MLEDGGVGSSIGTGFLLHAPFNESSNKSRTFLISNKHVFANPLGKLQFNFNREKKENEADLGNIISFEQKGFSHLYTEHPDPSIDLACVNVSSITMKENQVFYRNLNIEMVVDFSKDKLLPGAEVWFVGYPENRFDTVNNLPLLRKGHISSLPKVDFNSKPQIVIDAQVFPGSSGSPVFTEINGSFKLLGIVTETMIKHGKLQVLPALHNGMGIQQTLGLGLVLKATLLQELIESAMGKISS